MQSVNELWNTLRALPDTEVEWRFDINGVTYGPENEVSHDANHALFSEFGFGNATCGGLNLQLYADNIPKGAEIKRFCRLVNGAQVSEWLPMGVYYINRRSEEDGYWEIEAFDNMRKAEKVWEPDQSLTFPMPMDEAVAEICRVLGFTLDSRTTLSHAYTLDYPESEQTYRRTLQMIAAAHGGNFVFTGEGKLRLVPLISLPEESFYLVDQNGNPITFGGQRITVGDGESANPFDPNGVKHLVGLDLFSIRDNGKSKPVSRVTLLADDENAYTAGDDTGMELVADCAYATQEMVNALLSTFEGFVYQAFEADGANIDPAAELGDGITAGGLYSILGELNENGSGYPDIAAPGKEELEDEYPSQGPVTQQFNRKLAQTRSLIEKTAEQIALRITSAEAESLIKQRLDSIELSVSSSKGSTTFTLTSDGVELSSETLNLSVNAVNISGKLTASQIDATDLKVNAANITGTLYIGDLEDDVGLVTEDNVTTITSNAIRTASISADQIESGTLSADVLELDGLLELTDGGYGYGYMGVNTSKGGPVISDSSMNVFFVTTSSAAKMSYEEDKMIWVANGGCYSSYTMQVYSDRRLKNSINYDLSKAEALFPLLKPCSFIMNSDKDGKTNWGFISNEVIESATLVGLDAEKLALIGKSGEMNTLAYGQITALNTHMIQKLMARVAQLEDKNDEV